MATGDAAELVRHRALPEVARYQGWVPESLEEVVEMIARMEGSGFPRGGEWFQLAMVAGAAGGLVGDLGVCVSAGEARKAEVGTTLDPAFQGRGYAPEALAGVLGYLFEAGGCHRVHASVDPRNEASVRLFERGGFRREGHLAESCWFRGQWVNDSIFGLLRSEWGNSGER